MREQNETALVASRLQSIGEDLAMIAASLMESANPIAPPPRHSPHGASRNGLCDVAEQIYRDRRRRDSVLPPVLRGEPAWDMLLDLYITARRNRQASVGDLSIGAGVPATTALRWIQMLVDMGLVDREPDLKDRRRTFLRISPAGETLMENCLGSLKR